MSRAYRIEVKECLRTTLKGEDRVSTRLELLDLLPRDQMASLLADELAHRGFVPTNPTQPHGPLARAREDGLVVEIDPRSGEVVVRLERERETELEGGKIGITDTDLGKRGELDLTRKLRADLLKELEETARKQSSQLQREVTDQLERELGDLRIELDQVVNRVTVEALKRKAAAMGRIKEISENPDAGAVTIVLEV
ncbi:hypothetical protein Isop_0544 [Isosphaera pallida ATCC 43644]|uniref:FtsH ternary system domain-containing protein n=1 Tax=Isosphaera pallida (strain ATCC 43644 / DSM 9630 / IS1B) TaxID=575540 RepID=E8R019_ISOPI|nr:hypothetical protein [Isosphaera pallida]ADV61137.1 hypothetical protein Isop_0544 [Isosphaera pallida ATCC 43644]